MPMILGMLYDNVYYYTWYGRLWYFKEHKLGVFCLALMFHVLYNFIIFMDLIW